MAGIKNLEIFLPFLRWFPMSRDTLRSDALAGITVALILVPQSMAYAQLAGLPVVYGLYASFIPVIVASLWGSSSQLHTGPVAMLSLMSAAALVPFASPGSSAFIELSVMLALMVGVLRLSLGLFKLGAIVNLLSSPVIVGFTNAAALIIGLSQLSKIIGVPFPRSDRYLADLWQVVEQVGSTHWPTLLFALGAYGLIATLRHFRPSWPGVLIAVLAATVIANLIDFERKTTVPLVALDYPAMVEKSKAFEAARERIDMLTREMAELSRQHAELAHANDADTVAKVAGIEAALRLLDYQLVTLKGENRARRIALHAMGLTAVARPDGTLRFQSRDAPSTGIEGDRGTWRFAGLTGDRITLTSGGAVIGEIPRGLPGFGIPNGQWDLVLALLPAALVMALIGFMEATSIAKAIATTTGERVDTSKELVGQGLANIAGSFFSSYTVSGSFSRSAVAAKAGARTGLFAIISALVVVLVLLFFTTYLYSLPQSVLAVVVMMAVFGLIRVSPLVHAWKADRPGAVIGILTFIATLALAPSIANGILLGISLTVIVALFKGMRPRAEIVARRPDGTLSGIHAHGLEPVSQRVVPVRFDGPLTFTSVAYFEDVIIEAVGDFPDARAILVIGSGINEIDASGDERVREVARHLRERNIDLYFSGLKHQVVAVFERTGFVDELGRDRFFPNKERALGELLASYDPGAAGVSLRSPPAVPPGAIRGSHPPGGRH